MKQGWGDPGKARDVDEWEVSDEGKIGLWG